MLSSPLGLGHSVPIMGSLHDRNHIAKRMINPSTQRLEATVDPTAVETIALGSKVLDHLLLTVQAMVNDT